MKGVFLAFSLAWLLANSACTTLQPTEASPEQLQRLILSENLLKPGQRVRLVTNDEAEHQFRIAEVDLEREVVTGDDEAVLISEIVAVETREVSVGRTALLTGGLAYGGLFLIAIALAPALILGGG